MGITKTDFMRGMQCPKMLWLDKHKPKLKVIPPEVQRRLDAGNDFGDQAMGMFGPYEEMTVYLPGTHIPDTKAMVQKTQEHLEAGTPVICEAAFSNYNNYCAVDILRKTEDGYDFYEVKNSPEVYPQFVKDAAFQHYIISRCKVKIGHVYIVIHGEDENNPFVPVDVTADVSPARLEPGRHMRAYSRYSGSVSLDCTPQNVRPIFHFGGLIKPVFLQERDQFIFHNAGQRLVSDLLQIAEVAVSDAEAFP